MKTNSFVKSLGIIGTFTMLALSATEAKPDEDNGKDAPSSEKSGRQADKKEGKAGKKDQAPGKQNSGKDIERDKQERGPDNKNPAGDSKDRKDERKDDRQDRAQDRQADVRQENRADNKRRGEFKGRFEGRDRDRVVTYFSQFKGNDRGLPPGLAHRWDRGQRLPTGWRDRLVTGYVIQDDWYPAFEPVPYTWFPDIVVVPDTRLYWYGDRVVRVYEPTREVVDVVIVPTIHIDL